MADASIKVPPALSSAAVDVLGQLFTTGPTWDGNIVSKSGRGELVAAGLAFHLEGFASLTPEGMLLAIKWDRSRDRYGQWYCKQNDIPWPRRDPRS